MNLTCFHVADFQIKPWDTYAQAAHHAVGATPPFPTY